LFSVKRLDLFLLHLVTLPEYLYKVSSRSVGHRRKETMVLNTSLFTVHIPVDRKAPTAETVIATFLCALPKRFATFAE
jgi:hypothetical protein